MAPLNPIQQQIFEEGPKSSVGMGSVTPFVYQETYPILPAPINPNIAVTDQQAWYKLGAEAFNIAGKLYKEVLDYQIGGQEANIQSATFDAEAEIDEKYSILQEKIAEVQLNGQSLDPGVYTQYQKDLNNIKGTFQEKAKQILGEDSYNFYTKSTNAEYLKDVGTAYRRLALQTRKSNYDIDSTIAQNFIAASNSIRSANNSYSVNSEAQEAYINYHKNGTMLNKSQYDLFIPKVDFSKPLNTDTTPEGEQQRDQSKQYARAVISESGVGKILPPGVEVLENGLSENSSEYQQVTALQILSLASQDQLNATFTDPLEQLKYSVFKSLLLYTSPDEVKKLVKIPNISKSFIEFRGYLQSKQQPEKNQRGHLNQHFADIQGIEDLLYNAIKKKYEEEKRSYLSMSEEIDATGIKNSPVFQAQLASMYFFTSVMPDGDGKTETISKLAENFSLNPTIHFYENGLISTKSNLVLGATTKSKLAIYNQGMKTNPQTYGMPRFGTFYQPKNTTKEPLTETELAAKAMLTMPISLNSLGNHPTDIADSMGRELNLGRTAIPTPLLQEIVYALRHSEKNSYGKTESHGASQSDILVASLVSSDEFLRKVMIQTLGKDRLPTDKQITFTDNRGITRTTTEKEYAFYKGWHMVPSADKWEMQIRPHQTGELYYTFTNIPVTFTENNKTTTINLLQEHTIVPPEMIFPLGFTLYNPAGQTPLLKLELAVDPDQRTAENTYIDSYLDKLINNTSTSPEILPSYFDINAESPQRVISDYFKNSERLITPSNNLGPVFQPKAPQTIDSLPNTDVFKKPLEDFVQYLTDKQLPLLNRVVEEDGSLTPLISLDHLTATLNSEESQVLLAEYLSTVTPLNTTQARAITRDIFLLDFPPPTSIGKSVTIEELIYSRNAGKPYGYAYLDVINAIFSYLNPSSSLSLDLQNNPKYFSENPSMEEAMSLGLGPRQPIPTRKPFTLLFDSEQETPNNTLFGVGTNNIPGLLYDGGGAVTQFTPSNKSTAVDYVELKDQDDIQLEEEVVDYDLQTDSFRPDGTTKGSGWLGKLKTPNGKFTVTEYSVGVEFDISPIVKFNGIIPTLVPGLSKEQIDSVLLAAQLGTKVPDDVMEIAVEHAKKRLSQGKSVFKEKKDDAGNKKQETQVSPGSVSDKPYASLITEFEGLKTEAYWDDTGKVWTIGKGTTTYKDGTPVKKGDKISKEEADVLMHDFIDTKIIPRLAETIPTWTEMNKNQQSALISFAYNMRDGQNFYGKKNFETITKAVSSVDNFKDVPAALLLYNKSGGKFSKGLARRRKAEADLWNSKVAAKATKVVDGFKFEYKMSSSIREQYYKIYGPELAEKLFEKAKKEQSLEKYSQMLRLGQPGSKITAELLQDKLVRENAILPSYTSKNLDISVPMYERPPGSRELNIGAAYLPDDGVMIFDVGKIEGPGSSAVHEFTHATQTENPSGLPESERIKTSLLKDLNPGFIDMLASDKDKLRFLIYLVSPIEFPAHVAQYKAEYYKDTGKILSDIGSESWERKIESFKTWLKTYPESRGKVAPQYLHGILESPKSPLYKLFMGLIKQVAFVNTQKDKNTRLV